ncbi:hypothetical protein [Zavarzinia aquatilis]|uniref:Bacteriophage Mu GpT domain-containing protein n=1 Tax=Zavarzinia aquatilis TaxID=2211142 RepID=A0A317DUM9_9PROT|nr:hypothetical protein [Zavarzinia aquatilis]PWR17680.1 hypothetical protein DKG74_20545 [Zavarzinia aquatilis]
MNKSAPPLTIVTLLEADPETGSELHRGVLDVIEAEGAPGRLRVRVLSAGLSGNRNYYPDEVLRESAAMFEGIRVIVKPDAVHLAGAGKDPRGVIGRLTQPKFVAGAGKDKGSIEAVFEALDDQDPMVLKLFAAAKRGMTDVFGLSIDARAAVREAQGVRHVARFIKINSVDVIVEPGAGGRVLDVIEAAPEQELPMRAKLIATIKAKRPALLAGRDANALTDDELEVLLTEALGAPVDPQAPAGLTQAQLAEALVQVEAKTTARATVAASSLPATAKERVIATLEAQGDWGAAATAAAIKAEQDYLAPFVDAGRVGGLGGISRIQTGETRAEKVQAMLEAFWDPTHRDHGQAQSIKDIYVQITGDTRVTGRVRDCDQGLLREALNSASFGEVLGDAIHRRLVADYRSPSVYDAWRSIVNVRRLGDFRTNHIGRLGGYGDLPAVAEGADYTALTSPGDEEATYAPTKRGGLETITLEMIKNDDVAALMKIPGRMSRAAKRTLGKFVFDFIRTNPTIYDTVALFHATHGNLGSAALDAASFAAARLAMLKQTEAGSNDRIGIGPRFLLVSADGEEGAVNLFRRNTNNDKTFVQTLTPDIIPVWYWTDANDWSAVADPADIETIEIGFLDGQEEPELFVQDNPTVGSLFTADKLTYKIRHIYGGAVVDFRGFYKAVVA